MAVGLLAVETEVTVFKPYPDQLLGHSSTVNWSDCQGELLMFFNYYSITYFCFSY